MIEIKDLLFKFDKILLSEEIQIESLRNILEKIIKIKISKKDIKIKNNTVYLNIKPIYKNEIFLYKADILSDLQESQKNSSKRSPKEIR